MEYFNNQLNKTEIRTCRNKNSIAGMLPEFTSLNIKKG